jgi:hypothetical protein
LTAGRFYERIDKERRGSIVVVVGGTMEETKWVQIHTNGANTTFARWYTGQNENGGSVYIFEKMGVDITAGGHAELFGSEQFAYADEARERVRVAVRDAQ